jgi:virginiamycin B lyase
MWILPREAARRRVGSVLDVPRGRSTRLQRLSLGILLLALVSACGGNPNAGPTSPLPARSIPTLSAQYVALPTPNAAPTGITQGPDGAFWATEENGNHIARVTEAGAVTEFPLPHAGAPGLGILTGPDGALWFTNRGADEIDRMTTTGAVTRFALPHGSVPLGICSGPLGSLWITQNGTGEVDRMSADGTITPVANLGPDSSPIGIVAGVDGNLWIAEGSAIARLTPQGVVTTFPLPDENVASLRIVNGVHGDLWFVEEQGERVGYITPAGKVSLLPQILDAPPGIVEASDGHMWVTEQGDGRIDRIDGSHVTPFSVGTFSAGPEDLVAGPGHTLWFTEFNAGSVGWFSVDAADRRPSGP